MYLFTFVYAKIVVLRKSHHVESLAIIASDNNCLSLSTCWSETGLPKLSLGLNQTLVSNFSSGGQIGLTFQFKTRV